MFHPHSFRPLRPPLTSVVLLVTAALLALGAGSARAAAPRSPRPPASGVTVSLSASPSVLAPGQTATLTAVLSQTVLGKYVHILGSDGSHFACFSDVPCSPQVTPHGGAIVDYQAFLANNNPDPFVANQLDVVAASNSVSVTWLAVVLRTSARVLPPGATAVLTALTSANVLDGTFHDYDLLIFDATTGARLADCGFGAACSAVVSQSTPTVHQYAAYVAAAGSSALPPANVRGSAGVAVAWGSVSLSASAGTVSDGTPVTLTAATTFDLGPTPDFVKLYDATANAFVTDSSGTVVRCGGGTSCSFSVSQPVDAEHSYVAVVAGADNTVPPAFDLISSTRTEVWHG